MEDPKPIPQTQVPNPPNPTPPSSDTQSKKRKIDIADLQNTKYFKIRAIIKDLRPSVVEVLRAPDFRHCKAAHEIRKQMLLVLELSKQLGTETGSEGNPKKPLESQPLVAEVGEEKIERRPEEKPALQPQPEKVPDKVAEEKLPGEKTCEKQSEDGVRGSYVIGGSPIGWNFMVYLGSTAIYYGETKASFVARQPKSSDAPES